MRVAKGDTPAQSRDMLGAMKVGVSPLERAFQIARSGNVGTVQEIKTALEREGYSSWVIEGPTLSKQLRKIIQEAKEAAKPQ